MEFIFWQNIVSIHQSAFISALAEEHEVTLVAEREIDASRRAQGWKVPSMGRATIVVSPEEEAVARLVEERAEAVHVFSGIDAYPMVYSALRRATAARRKEGVLAEPYRYLGFKGALRQLKYRLLFARYGRHIDFLMATGETGVKSFVRAGFPEEKLFEWGYFVSQESLIGGVILTQGSRACSSWGSLTTTRIFSSCLNAWRRFCPRWTASPLWARGRSKSA